MSVIENIANGTLKTNGMILNTFKLEEWEKRLTTQPENTGT
jgi:hypothetical protein